MKRSDFLLTLAGFGLTLFAAPNLFAESKKMSRKEFEEFLKSQVKTDENGDVYIDLKPSSQDIIKKVRFVEKEESFPNGAIKMQKLRPGIISPVILRWLCLYEPILNFEIYCKLLDEEEKKLEKERKKRERNAGKRYTQPKIEKKKPNKYSPVPPLVVEFLDKNDVGLRVMSFSKQTVIEKLKDGHPFLCYGGFRGDLEERNEKRKTFKNILEWRDALSVIRKSKSSITSFGVSFITGFNEQSREFKMCDGIEKSYWITDDELKDSCEVLIGIVL